MSTSVLVVDDQPLFCSGIELLIDAQPDMAFAGAAHSGTAAVAAAARVKPDVVLMDLRMPDGDGVQATEAIRHGPNPPRVLVLTTFRDQRIVQRALAAGATGFITKDALPHELLSAIRDVAAGRSVASTKPATRMLHDPLFAPVPDPSAIAQLTPRQQAVFLHVARGMTNNEIASATHTSENTVRTHVSAILQKLALDNRTQVAAFAYRAGLLPAPLRQ